MYVVVRSRIVAAKLDGSGFICRTPEVVEGDRGFDREFETEELASRFREELVALDHPQRYVFDVARKV